MSAEDVRSGRTTVLPRARTFGVNPKTCPSALAACSGAEEESATTNAVSNATVMVVVLDVFKSLVTSAFAALVLTESLAFLLPILFGFVSSALLRKPKSHPEEQEDEHDERENAIIFVVVVLFVYATTTNKAAARLYSMYVYIAERYKTNNVMMRYTCETCALILHLKKRSISRYKKAAVF